MAEKKACFPTCQSFKCAKNAAVNSRDGVWCRWTEENCNIANCTYAMCMKRRLLPKGICGETVKRRTVDKQPEEIVSSTIKLRGKALRKVGEKEIF